MKKKPHGRAKRNPASRSYYYQILKLRKPPSLTACRAPMRSAAIDTQLTNSLTGIVLSRECHSARPWSSGTECT